MLVKIHAHSRKNCYFLYFVPFGPSKKFMNSPFTIRKSVVIKITFILFTVIFYYIFNIFCTFFWRNINCIFSIYNYYIIQIICYNKLSLCIVYDWHIFTIILYYIIRMCHTAKFVKITYIADIFPAKFCLNNFYNTVLWKYNLLNTACRNIFHHIFRKADASSYCRSSSLCKTTCII